MRDPRGPVAPGVGGDYDDVGESGPAHIGEPAGDQAVRDATIPDPQQRGPDVSRRMYEAGRVQRLPAERDREEEPPPDREDAVAHRLVGAGGR